MGSFDRIAQALAYIDEHLDEPLSVEAVASAFHFSAFYFHRMFTAIVGAPMAAYIRGRRLSRACAFVVGTALPMTEIALCCGFDSPQSFSRAFRSKYRQSPSAYRLSDERHSDESVEEMIRRFTNRLQGGMVIMPNIIKRDELIIAGVSGDGNRTGEVWEAFMAKAGELTGKLSDNGYEVRIVSDGDCLSQTVHVGFTVRNAAACKGFEVLTIPASEYASFDVYVEQGYDSENSAMDEWLRTNGRYRQRLLNERPYVVEYYDERFKGEESGSIVEIWVPVERV